MGIGTNLLIFSFCIAFALSFLTYTSPDLNSCSSMLGQLSSGSLDITHFNADLLNSILTILVISGGAGVVTSLLVGNLSVNFTIPLSLLLGVMNFFVMPLGFVTECPLPFEIKILFFGVVMIMTIVTILNFVGGRNL